MVKVGKHWRGWELVSRLSGGAFYSAGWPVPRPLRPTDSHNCTASCRPLSPNAHSSSRTQPRSHAVCLDTKPHFRVSRRVASRQSGMPPPRRPRRGRHGSNPGGECEENDGDEINCAHNDIAMDDDAHDDDAADYACPILEGSTPILMFNVQCSMFNVLMFRSDLCQVRLAEQPVPPPGLPRHGRRPTEPEPHPA
jgi:hypothetical protein